MNRSQQFNAALLAMAAFSLATPGLTVGVERAAAPRPPRRPDGNWLFDWKRDPEYPGAIFARRGEFEFAAFDDGAYMVHDGGDLLLHTGKAKNPRLTTAMASAEKWWGLNCDKLLGRTAR